jgi:ribosomal protein L31
MKTPCISFNCPSCNSSFEVFLKKQPELMTFNCPTCKVSLSFYDGQTTINDTVQEQLSKVKSQSEINSIFNSLDKKIQLKSKHIITHDDVVNFQIDLASCKTFDDVMRLICQIA